MNTLLLVCGIVFSIVAVMHLLRVCFKTQVIIGSKVIPLWVSVIGFILPVSLAVWIFMTLYSLNV